MYLGSVSAAKMPNIWGLDATDNHLHRVTIYMNEQSDKDKTFKINTASVCAPSDSVACVKFVYNGMLLTASAKNEKIFFTADPNHPAVIFCGTAFVASNQAKVSVTGRIRLK